MSFDKMIEKIIKTGNPTVAGLDPKLDFVPDFIKNESFSKYGQTLEGAADALYRFNCGLIDELHDIVPAVKPQAAYYEMYGPHGVIALKKTIDYAKAHDMFVIVDGKRNDIGTTMEAYAKAYLGVTVVGEKEYEPFGADALTVNGYLGTDGIAPLTDICRNRDKGIFVLVKTSNPSSGELQDQKIDGNSIYSVMGGFCETWGEELHGSYGYSAVGAVVGATYKEQLAEMRKQLPHTFFLVPGYGAQGGSADSVAVGFDDNGLGSIINSSRAIMCAYKKEESDPVKYAEAARRESIRMRDQITAAIK